MFRNIEINIYWIWLKSKITLKFYQLFFILILNTTNKQFNYNIEYLKKTNVSIRIYVILLIRQLKKITNTFLSKLIKLLIIYEFIYFVQKTIFSLLLKIIFYSW